jgi:hypothetical protein
MDEKLLKIHDRLVNYFISGEMAFAVLNTIRKERENHSLIDNDLFVFTSVVSTFSTAILVMANTIKPNSDSIHLAYLLNHIKLSEGNIDPETYKKLSLFVLEFEDELTSIKHITDRVIALRDTTVAHIDRKHVNNLDALLQSPPISWEDMTFAYSVVGSGLLEVGKHLGLDSNIQDYITLANFALENKTRLICRLP